MAINDKPVAKKTPAAKTAPKKTPAKTVAKPAAKAAAKKPAVKQPTAAAKTPAKKAVAKKTTMDLDLTAILESFKVGGKAPRNARLPGSVDDGVKAKLDAEAKRLKVSVSALVAAIVAQYIAAL